MEALSQAHALSITADDGWCNASTASVEFYEYKTEDVIAIIFRHRDSRHGYLACVAHAGHQLMADTHFSTVDAAKLWVAYHVVRWRLRPEPPPALTECGSVYPSKAALTDVRGG